MEENVLPSAARSTSKCEVLISVVVFHSTLTLSFSFNARMFDIITGSAPDVVKSKIALVVVLVPSSMVTNQSYAVPGNKPGQLRAVLLPDATFVLELMSVNDGARSTARLNWLSASVSNWLSVGEYVFIFTMLVDGENSRMRNHPLPPFT